MGLAMELISGRVTAPGAALTAWTVNTGNSLTIRQTHLDRMIWLLSAWANNSAVGQLRVISPKLHDNVQGIRLGIPASEVQPLFPYPAKQRLYAQDALVVQQSGSAVAANVELGSLLVFYEDLQGVEGNFIDADTLFERTEHVMGVANTITTTATGDYGGEEAINAEMDQFKANSWYALIGYTVDTAAGAVRWRGTDVGNLGVGGPAAVSLNALTSQWFARLAREYRMPMVPVFNSANKDNILIDATQDDVGADITVNSIFALLSPGPLPVHARRA